ncbi:MAG: hypothetical protein ABUS57_13685 [Pseudomonadota bacterium]
MAEGLIIVMQSVGKFVIRPWDVLIAALLVGVIAWLGVTWTELQTVSASVKARDCKDLAFELSVASSGIAGSPAERLRVIEAMKQRGCRNDD